MNISIWPPLIGIWVLGMLVAAVVVRTRSIRFWVTTAVDLAGFAAFSVALLAGVAALGERSQELLGVPSDWVVFAFCLVALRGLLILKTWHGRSMPRA